MRTYDFAPLWRSSVGFDRLFDLINDTQRLDAQDNYPPYDIVRTGENAYRIPSPSPASHRTTSASRRSRNGLLQIELARKIPEAMKPRRIEIGAGASARKTEKMKTVDQVRAAS